MQNPSTKPLENGKCREWVSWVGNRSGNYLPEPIIREILADKRCKGYSSLYYFGEEILEQRKIQSSQLTKKYSVGANRLLIDVDTGYNDTVTILRYLESKGLNYALYNSGGKGFHVYIYHKDIFDVRLPYSHYRWVADNIPIEVDYSIYHQNSLISNIGRIHRKTGNKKKLVKKVKGKLLDIELQEGQKTMTVSSELSDKECLQLALTHCLNSVLLPPKSGNRHKTLWKIAHNFILSGLSQSATFELIKNVNNHFAEPKSIEELKTLVLSIKPNT